MEVTVIALGREGLSEAIGLIEMSIPPAKGMILYIYDLNDIVISEVYYTHPTGKIEILIEWRDDGFETDEDELIQSLIKFPEFKLGNKD